MDIRVYTDGSATTSDKPGGWAWVLLLNNEKYDEGSGHLTGATNNDAELIAAIQGLEAASQLLINNSSSWDSEFTVTLVSDSEIILNWASGKYQFKQQEKMVLYNAPMRLVKKMSVKTEWAKGHSGNEFNERYDELANIARKSKDAPKPKKEKKKKEFRWSELVNCYGCSRKEYLGRPSEWDTQEAIRSLANVVLELMELQEKK